MKINEIIVEDGHRPDPKKLPHDHIAAIKGATSNPALSMNKSDGSSYMQYRHGIALACAGAGSTPSIDMDPDGAFSGDPVFASYADIEEEMIDNAAKVVGAGTTTKLSPNKSTESDDTYKTSPVPHNAGVKKRKSYWMN